MFKIFNGLDGFLRAVLCFNPGHFFAGKLRFSRKIFDPGFGRGVPDQQVRTWKREFLEKMHLAFERDRDTLELQKELEKAYRKIGQLELERDFLSGLLKSS